MDRTILAAAALAAFLAPACRAADALPARRGVGALALSADGATLYLSAAREGALALDARTGAPRPDAPPDPRARLDAPPADGEFPAVAFSPDGAHAVAADRAKDVLRVYALPEGRLEREVPSGGRQPVALAYGADGLLFVGHHVPSADPAKSDFLAANVTVFDAGFRQVASVPLPDGSSGLRGAAASPDGAYVAFAHTLGHYTLPVTQMDRGWIVCGAVTLFDGRTGKAVNTILLDEIDLGAPNPWAVAFSPDGARLAVTHAGAGELSLIDFRALLARLADAAAGKTVTDVTSSAAAVPRDMRFLEGIRARVDLKGDGPRALAWGEAGLFAANYFSQAVVKVDLSGRAPRAETFWRSAEPPAAETRGARRGELLYNDAKRCFQRWQSCASCHPDGAADGLKWDFPNKGRIGEPILTRDLRRMKALTGRCVPDSFDGDLNYVASPDEIEDAEAYVRAVFTDPPRF